MTTVSAGSKPATNEDPTTIANAPAKPAQIRVARRSPAYWRVTIDNPARFDWTASADSRQQCTKKEVCRLAGCWHQRLI